MGAAVVLPLRVAVPIDAAFGQPAPGGCRLKRCAAQRHVNAGYSLMESETTDAFVKLHYSVEIVACLDNLSSASKWGT